MYKRQAYGLGHSEEVVGRALKGRRDKVVVSTKCGLQWYDGEGTLHMKRDGAVIMRNLSPKSIRRDLEKSLKRLDTDYIDVYYTHWQSVEPFFIPVQETMAELMKMKQEGKIRAIGASNVTVDHMKEYLKYGQLDVIPVSYTHLDVYKRQGYHVGNPFFSQTLFQKFCLPVGTVQNGNIRKSGNLCSIVSRKCLQIQHIYSAHFAVNFLGNKNRLGKIIFCGEKAHICPIFPLRSQRARNHYDGILFYDRERTVQNLWGKMCIRDRN